MQKIPDTKHLDFLQSKGIDLCSIAKSAGWSKRSDGLLSPSALLRALLIGTSIKQVSLNKLAVLCATIGAAVSKQAIAKRLARRSVELLESVFKAVVACAVAQDRADAICGFSRVIMQDSTSIKLPDKLAATFPTTCRGKATMKAQSYLELGSGKLLAVSCSSQLRNDQSASEDVLEVARRGDLVVRDLGYFSLKAFAKMIAAGIEVLSRYKSDTRIFTQEGEEVDLAKELAAKRSLDRSYLFGASQMLKLRLVAFELPARVAEERLRRANADAKKRGKTLSRRVKDLLRWQIYLTSCPPERLSAEQAYGLYRQRWGIEMFFKTMKSHLQLADIPAYASERLCRCLVLACFIKAAAMAMMMAPLLQLAQAKGSFVSPMKLLSVLEILFAKCVGPGSSCPAALDLDKLLRYCIHDKRKRKSLAELLRDMNI